jgi:hypothetical protein
MYGLKIVEVREHGTGYVEVVVRAVKTEGNSTVEGPEKTYGTDADRLKLQHAGSVANWLLSVKQEHQAHAGLHDSVLDQLHGFKGKIL